MATKYQMIDSLAEEIIKIDDLNHQSIQNRLKVIFKKFGFNTRVEEDIDTGRHGHIDLVARRKNYTIGIEIDCASIRYKSIEKLNKLNPNLAIFILRSGSINGDGNQNRIRANKVKSIIIDLPGHKIINY